MSSKSISHYSTVNTWMIENYLSYFCENGEPLASPVFHDGVQMQIKLYPRGVSIDYQEFISCFLEMKTFGDNKKDCKLELTDREGNVFATNKFRLMTFREVHNIGFPEFIALHEALAKMTKSRYRTIVIKFYMNQIESQDYCDSEFVSRTIIGVERSSFMWYLEKLDPGLSKRTTIHFPKSSEMEFRLSISEHFVTITVVNYCRYDSIYDEDSKQDDVKELNHYDDRFLLCEISFSNIEGKKLSRLSYVEFEDHDDKSRQCFYKFEKDSFQFDSIFPLECEICLSFGTYIKHINAEKED